MASLPPKPVSSPPPPPPPPSLGKDDDERRRHSDDRFSRHLSQEDRVYVPSNSGRYVAPYDRSRDEDRYAARYRDRDLDRRVRDGRDRGPRGREDDRDSHRRRDDMYVTRDDRRSRRPPSLRRPDRSYRSRSPRGRRPYSPPRHTPRFRHSRSPPPKRPRYNSRSPPRSPRSPRRRWRSRTPERRNRDRSYESARHRNESHTLTTTSSPKKQVARSRSRSRSPGRKVGEPKVSATSPSTNAAARKPPESSNYNGSTSLQSVPDESMKPKDLVVGEKQDQKPSLDQPQRSPENSLEPAKDEMRRSPKGEARVGHETEVKARERTPSPPRQPRYMNNQAAARDGSYPRRSSRSPPKGPRLFPRSSVTQSNSNLHSGRRLPGVSRGHDASAADVRKADRPERISVTATQDAEIARLESHRANLAAEYVNLAKNARRALHELDMAMLDLRAAEARRKVTASQLEKARAGMLGIDSTPIDSPVT